MLQRLSASLVKSKQGATIQQVVDSTYEPLLSFETARSTVLSTETVRISWKYGECQYRATGQVGQQSTGDGYAFFDAAGKEYMLVSQKKPRLSGKVYAYTEIWGAENLDPTYFWDLAETGATCIVLYTWLGNPLSMHQHFLDLAHLNGFGVVLQAVPDQKYTADLGADFSHLSSLFNHEAVIGLYLLDEPNPDTYPLTRQGEIIAKAKSLTKLPLYAATNAESNYDQTPVHKDFDYVFASNYSHFVGLGGIVFYETTTWASLEENGLRRGRVIPLMTAYWYENEQDTLQEEQIRKCNEYIAKGFESIGYWTYWTTRRVEDGKHCVEKSERIRLLLNNAMSFRSTDSTRVSTYCTFFRKTNPLPENCFKYLSKPDEPSKVTFADAATLSSWKEDAGVFRVKNGESVTFDFGRPVMLDGVTAAFTDNNGPTNTASISIGADTHINGGYRLKLVELTGGGDVSLFVNSLGDLKFPVTKISFRVTASTGSDYLILERLRFAIRAV